MVLLFGTNFQPANSVSRALQSFYGIGPAVCTRIMAKFSLYKVMTIGQLGDRQKRALEEELASMTLEEPLRRQVRANIARLRDIGSYRGRRHALGLPVRGQRTHNNSFTAKKLNKIERKG